MDPSVYAGSRLPSLLAALVLAFVLMAPARAQQVYHGHLDPEHRLEGAGEFIIQAGPDGGIVCESAVIEEVFGPMAARRGAALHLTPLPSLNPEASLDGLRIVLRATDQLLGEPEALLAFRRAAARWERRIDTPITVIIDVDYGPERFDTGPYPTNVLGSTSTAPYFARTGPAGFVDRLKAQNPGDPQLQTLYDAIPIPTPSTAGEPLGQGVGALANLQALGFFPPAFDPDPSETPFGSVPNIGFNSAFTYDFDPSDGISARSTDFDAVAVHEIGHALGFTSIIGSGGPPNNYFYTWDLFRVRPEDVAPGEPLSDGEGFEAAPRVVTPGPANTEPLVTEGGTTYYEPVQVFFDGPSTYEVSTATGRREDGDGQQASHWRDDALRPPSLGAARKIGIMDPNLTRGVRDTIQFPDLRMLEVIGYRVTYEPTWAQLEAVFNEETVPLTVTPLPDTVRVGDSPSGTPLPVPLVLRNLDLDARLDYRLSVELGPRAPAGLEPTIVLDRTEGSIAPGDQTAVTVTVGAAEPAFVLATLRIETNDPEAPVVEVPFSFTTEGAVPPALTLDADALLTFGVIGEDEVQTRTITLANAGTLPLQYRIATALSTRRVPFDAAPDRSFSPSAARGAGGQLPPPLLSRLLGARAADASVLLQTDFEEDFGGFIPTGTFLGDWQRVTVGAAELPGHSRPTAVYFGVVDTDPTTGEPRLQYRNNARSLLLSPAIDMSGIAPQDRVVLAFNYYLQAEEGYDFASVVVTYDDGETFEVVASSDEGILQNTDEWRAVLLDLPGFAGFPGEVRFGFLFDSDGGVVDEGWYLDDVELAVMEGGNPFYAVPSAAVIPDSTALQPVEVTLDGGALEAGFYRGTLRVLTNAPFDPDASVSFDVTIGDPAFPTIEPAETELTAVVEVGRTEEAVLTFRNTGDAPLTFVRLLEPALRSFADADAARLLARGAVVHAPEGDLLADAETVPEIAPDPALTARITAQAVSEKAAVVLPGAGFSLGIAELADGRIVVAEVGTTAERGRTFVLSPDLQVLTSFQNPVPEGQQVTGLTFNERTGTLWYALFQHSALYEVAVTEAGFTPTSNVLPLGLNPVSTAYSAALDAYFVIQYDTDFVYVYGTDGAILPGYPQTFARGSSYQGLSVSGGVVEIGYQDNANAGPINFLQYDQFIRPYEGSRIVSYPAADLGGSRRVNGHVRSRIDPNGRFFFVTQANEAGEVRVGRIDPPDLPQGVIPPVKAAEPAYAYDLPSGDVATLNLLFDTGGREPGIYESEVAFLVNNPADRVVRIPVRLEVVPEGTTGGEDDELPLAFELHPPHPNPALSAAILTFDLPRAARVSLNVYDILGRRVATLYGGEELEAGAHTLQLDASALAAGTYLIRFEAETFARTQRLTLVR